MSFVRFVCCSDPVEDKPRSQGSLLPVPNPGNEVGGRIVYQTKQFWSVFPDGFLENFTGVRSMLETFLGKRICSYVEELESLGQE